MSHFNAKAKEWDSQEKIKSMANLAAKTIDFLKPEGLLDIMDFGCGTGLFGLEFEDYIKTLTGVDTSPGMLEVFDEKTKGNRHLKSLLIDLEKEDLDQNFDLIISSMAFHHLNEPQYMLRKLKEMLNPGGKLAIIDLDEEDGTFHPDNTGMGVKHFGFSKNTLAGWADQNQLNFEHTIISSIEKNDRAYGQFLAVFTKE